MSTPLLDRFVIDEAVVTLGDRTLRLHKPRSAEDLISEEDFARDERLPYWADLWPSAHVLAARVLAEADPAWRALELGCGLGLASLAASARGLSVTSTDYYEDALAFVGHNAARNALPLPTLRHADWRDWPADLQGFDLVLGADILYERPMGPQVAAVLARTLAPQGRAWVTDPGRVGGEPFVEACTAQGLRLQAHQHQHGEDDAPPRPITLYEVTRRATDQR